MQAPCAHSAGCGADVNDPPIAVFPHQRQDILTHQKDTGHIERKNFFPLLQRQRFHRAIHRHSRIVDQDIHFGVISSDPGTESLYLLRIGEVAGIKFCAQLFQLRPLFRTAANRQHLCALGHQLASRFLTDPGGRPGHDRNFSAKIHYSSSLSGIPAQVSSDWRHAPPPAA